MSLQTLPPDQRAVLQLLLQKDRSYDEIAQLLRLDSQTIRGRAHAAVDAVGPLSRDLSEDQRGELTDYLLGEQSASARAATRAFLEGSPAARAWARETAEALRPLGGDRLPEIPADPPGAAAPAAAPAPPAPVQAPPPVTAPAPAAEPAPETVHADDVEPEREPAPRPIPTLPRTAAERPEPIADAVDAEPAPSARGTGSRVGGMLLVFGVAAVLAVVLIVGLRALSGDDANTTSDAGGGAVATSPAPGTSTAPPAETTPTTSTQAKTTQTTATTPSVNAEIRMRPPSGGDARATVTLITQSGKQSIALAGSKLKATTDKAFYGLWLANSEDDALFLGYAPQVGENGRMRLFDSLPDTADPSQYREIWLTREVVAENTTTPTSPGEVALRGALSG